MLSEILMLKPASSNGFVLARGKRYAVNDTLQRGTVTATEAARLISLGWAQGDPDSFVSPAAPAPDSGVVNATRPPTASDTHPAGTRWMDSATGVEYRTTGGGAWRRADQSWDEVFVIAGQSNADGRGAIDATIEKSQPNVQMLDKSEAIRVAAEPLGEQVTGWINNIPEGVSPGAPGHSFGLRMGKEIARALGVRPILVPCAIGSTSMTHWMPGSDDLDRATLFGAMHYRAKSVAVPSRPPVVCWHGHESGAGGITEDLAAGTIDSAGYMTDWSNLMRAVRARFPDCPILYAQLATDDTSGTATKHRRAAEVQRRSEATHGNTDTILGYETIAANQLDTANFLALYQGAGSTTTLMDNGFVRINTNGSTAAGFRIATLEAGKYYRLSITVTGTGQWKYQASGAKGSGLGAGTHVLTFQADGLATLDFYRNSSGVAADLTFDIAGAVLEDAIVPSLSGAHMVVTHDLPRNANPDDVHLNAAGQRELGRRFALAYRQHVAGENVNGTGPRLASITKPTGTTVKVKWDRTIQAAANDYGDGTDSLFRVYSDGAEHTVSSVVRDSGDDTVVEITLSATHSGTVVVTYGDRPGPGDGTSYRQGVVYDEDNLPAPMFGPVVAA